VKQMLSHNGRQLLQRRDLFGQTVSGLAGVALASLLKQDAALANTIIPFDPAQPHAPRSVILKARRKMSL